jgi:alpha-beta hydrolase superfamily lysophospholipase
MILAAPKLTGTEFPGYEVTPVGAEAGLIIVHGIAEHGGRYRHVTEALARHHIACFVYDQRGHGASLGPRTHLADFAQFSKDLDGVGAAIQQRFPGLPLFVWGHSMGSVVVNLAALETLDWACGIITSGCALDAMPKLSGALGLIMGVASAVVPRLRIGLGIDATLLTQVPETQRQHMSDPLVPRTASLRLLYGFAQACKSCHTNLARINKPWLAIHGEADTVCPVSGSKTLIAGLASADKRLVTYPKLLHEVHNEDEPSRAALFELMSQWILQRSRLKGR